MENNGQNFDEKTKGLIRESQSVVQSKMQKVVTAVYLVSDILKESEPVRKRLRQLAIETLASLGRISLLSPSRSKKQITETQALIDQLQDTLRVAVSVGFVSDMNFKLVSDALVSVYESLNKQFFLLNSESSFRVGVSNRGVEEFVLPKDVTLGLQGEKTPRDNKGQIKDNKGQNSVSFTNQPEKTKSFQVDTDTREQTVVEYLKDKNEVSVSDVASQFPETSEKTIQRLLVKMVDKGVLEKVGEKRWSRYSLKS